MSDINLAYNQIIDFLSNENERTLLFRGFADKKKHQLLLKALNDQGKLTGLVNLIHTTIHGIEDFFRWADVHQIHLPKKYGETVSLSNLTFYFNNLSTKPDTNIYDNCSFDFMIIWPIARVSTNSKEIQTLLKIIDRQRTNKIILLTNKEPWTNPDLLKSAVDRIIKLDCENDDPEEYHRIVDLYNEDMRRKRNMEI